MYEDCDQHRDNYKNVDVGYCIQHKCAKKGCTNHRIEGNIVCCEHANKVGNKLDSFTDSAEHLTAKEQFEEFRISDYNKLSKYKLWQFYKDGNLQRRSKTGYT